MTKPRLAALLTRATLTMKKGQRWTMLEFTAMATDLAPRDGGVGAAGMPEEIRQAYLNMAAAKNMTRVSLADGIMAEPLEIFELEDEKDADFEAARVKVERVRLRQDEKSEAGKGVITWLYFAVRLQGDDAQKWAGAKNVGVWLWLGLKH